MFFFAVGAAGILACFQTGNSLVFAFSLVVVRDGTQLAARFTSHFSKLLLFEAQRDIETVANLIRC